MDCMFAHGLLEQLRVVHNSRLEVDVGERASSAQPSHSSAARLLASPARLHGPAALPEGGRPQCWVPTGAPLVGPGRTGAVWLGYQTHCAVGHVGA